MEFFFKETLLQTQGSTFIFFLTENKEEKPKDIFGMSFTKGHLYGFLFRKEL